MPQPEPLEDQIRRVGIVLGLDAVYLFGEAVEPVFAPSRGDDSPPRASQGPGRSTADPARGTGDYCASGCSDQVRPAGEFGVQGGRNQRR